MTYWLLFMSSNLPILRFLNKPFGHVFLLSKDEFNWYMLDPLHYYLRVSILPFDIKEDVPSLIKKDDFIVLKIEVDNEVEPPVRLRPCLFTCISLIKYMIGIRVVAFTPYGLYKKLMKMKKKQKFKAPILNVE